MGKWRKGGIQKDKRGKTAETIDYIFYTKEFECSQVLDITKDTLEHVRMPGWRYPSDHFSIVADLTLTPQPSSSVHSRPSYLAKSARVMVPGPGLRSRPSSPRVSPRTPVMRRRPSSTRSPPRSPNVKTNRRLAQREFST